MSDKITKLTDDSFQQEIAESQGLALVDFWAEWCGPCRALAPTLDVLAEESGAGVKIGKVDVDANPMLSETFQIRSIPTLVFFKDGVEIDRVSGVQSKSELEQRLATLTEAAA